MLVQYVMNCIQFSGYLAAFSAVFLPPPLFLFNFILKFFSSFLYLFFDYNLILLFLCFTFLLNPFSRSLLGNI